MVNTDTLTRQLETVIARAERFQSVDNFSDEEAVNFANYVEETRTFLYHHTRNPKILERLERLPNMKAIVANHDNNSAIGSFKALRSGVLSSLLSNSGKSAGKSRVRKKAKAVSEVFSSIVFLLKWENE